MDVPSVIYDRYTKRSIWLVFIRRDSGNAVVDVVMVTIRNLEVVVVLFVR